MNRITASLAAIVAAFLLSPAGAAAQAPVKAAVFTVAGHSGEAQLLQLNGKSYIEVETLARLTKGALSFKANRTTLTLPPPEPAGQAAAPPAKPGFSTAFVQAGIEEIAVIREWRIAIVNAVLNNTPVSEDWVAAQHRLADKNLALASAAGSTADDRSAFPLLSAEFNNMQKLSELYLAMRKQSEFISPDTFHSTPLEEQILTCARGFVAMTENQIFQDQPACH